MTVQLWSELMLVLLLLSAAARDLLEQRIPNSYLGAGLACAAILRLAGGGVGSLAWGATGALLGLAMLLPFYFFRGMGAGDVKLMAVVGAYIGPALVWRACFASVLAGGIAALVLLLRYGDRKLRMAYAPAIAAGTLGVLIVRSL
ncbi:MAG TPA: prepilin peptidase [Telluria sp.]|nr:prepilin peptidase [Telluria sp.]